MTTDNEVGREADDPINPSHYTSHPSGIECIEISKHLSGCLAQAFQYVWRCGQKDDPVQELKKAIWFIEAELSVQQDDRLIVRKVMLIDEKLKALSNHDFGSKFEALSLIANANKSGNPRYTMLVKTMHVINAMISEYNTNNGRTTTNN